MTHPDDATVVRVLAERDDWSPCNCGSANCYRHRKHGNKFLYDIGYLASTDAIRPVLAKLSENERWKLAALLEQVVSRRLSGFEWTYALLTLPPADLARAVASAIMACRKEGV